MLFPKMGLKNWNSATTAVKAVVAVYYIKTAEKLLKSFSARVMTPLKLVCYLQKYFQKIETAATTAATAVVAVYIKTA